MSILGRFSTIAWQIKSARVGENYMMYMIQTYHDIHDTNIFTEKKTVKNNKINMKHM